jgi:hypothetical protein
MEESVQESRGNRAVASEIDATRCRYLVCRAALDRIRPNPLSRFRLVSPCEKMLGRCSAETEDSPKVAQPRSTG